MLDFMFRTMDKPWWGLLLGVMAGMNLLLVLLPPFNWMNIVNLICFLFLCRSYLIHWFPANMERRIIARIEELVEEHKALRK